MAKTKQEKERIVLAALAVVACLVWVFYFRSSTSKPGGVGSGPYVPINAEDYGKLFVGLGDSRSTEYKPSGRNIFIAGPILSAANTAPGPAAPPPFMSTGPMPPPEPPLPTLEMKFFGYGTTQGNGPRRAFLQDGDEVHIVSEGDTIQNHLRITHISNDRIEFEDINTGKKNSKNLEMPPAV